MLAQERQLADASDALLAQVPLGRNRFLRGMGVALFAFATQLFVPRYAAASHDPPPNPCYGYHECYNCSYCSCTDRDCRAVRSHCPPAGTNNQCWNRCYRGRIVRCCDWYSPRSGYCICGCDSGPC